MKKFFFFFLAVFLASCGQNAHNMPFSGSTSEVGKISVSSSLVGEKIANDAGYNQCIESAKISCGNNFITAYAQNNSNTEICEQFGDENLKNACKEMVITETAKKTLDPERCDALQNADIRATCKQGVIFAKGVKNSDPTLCSHYELTSTETDTLQNMKDRCVMHIIDRLEQNEKTKGLCGLIINEELKNSCEQQVQGYMDIVAENAQNTENSENPENIPAETPAE